jgi:alkanesulfonate monooxygenase SsuD/methylene tetrahydromethanopterin reductase-like flavin-dependent oxidoreductase (luciferase family)
MEVDLILDARADADELAELGVRAEQKGFSGIWVSSLLDARDPFANMMQLARSTSRIKMGPIAVNPWDMHPVKISSALHTLNEASGGRARIVIGGGGEALASLGLKPERRVRAVQECIEIIRIASGGQRFDYEGQLYQAKGYGLGWLNAAPPNVYAGANMRQMLGMAGRVANGVMLSDMPPALAVSAIQTARETAAIKGRDPEALWFSSFTAWHVCANGEDAEREARRWLLLRGLFRPWVLAEFLEADEIDLIMASQPAFLQAFVAGAHEIEGVPEEVLEKIVANLTLTASSDNLSEVIAELCRYKALGLSSISLRLYADPAASIDLLAEQVLPHLKG